MTSDLITRLEQAEAGSRELDLAVAQATDQTWRYTDHRQPDGSFVIGDIHCGAFTRSLDAIVSLIGEKLPGWTWEVVSYGAACLVSPDNAEAMAAHGRGKTPQTGLCIALLRAIKEGADG